MNTKWIKKAVSLCLSVALLATYSTSVSAKTDRLAGELTVSGKLTNDDTPAVLVNGEKAQNGRSIFSSSTVTTPENANAIISIAKLGKVELAPNTTINITFDETGINGDLTAGKITVLGATSDVNIKTPNGQVTKLNVGDSAVAGKAQDDDDNNGGGAAWWLYALIFGGAVAGIVLAATADNEARLGGGTTVVSPRR